MNSPTAWIGIAGMISGVLFSSLGWVINQPMAHGQTATVKTSRLNNPEQSRLTQECPINTAIAAEHLGAHLPNRPVMPMDDTRTVKDFHLVGNQMYPDRHLREYLATALTLRSPYTATEVSAIAQEIQGFYIDNGYLGTWATVVASEPDTKDRLTIAILEGGLEAIRITRPQPQTSLTVDYLCDQLRAIAQPLQQDQLNATLTQLQQHPWITHIHSQLLPGTVPERQILQIEIIESQGHEQPHESISRGASHLGNKHEYSGTYNLVNMGFFVSSGSLLDN